MTPTPQIVRVDGALVANFGVAGDDIGRELAFLLEGVDRELAVAAAPVSWVLQRGTLATLLAVRARFAQWIERIGQLAARGVEQTVHAIEAATQAHAVLAAELAAHGVSLREPAVTGELPAELPLCAFRSPKMHELVLAADDRGITAVMQELLAREVPMMFIGDARGHIQLRDFGGTTALPVYPDVTTLGQVAKETPPPPNFTIGTISGRQLVSHAAERSLAIAICVYRDAAHPVSVLLAASAVSDLAQLAN